MKMKLILQLIRLTINKLMLPFTQINQSNSKTMSYNFNNCIFVLLLILFLILYLLIHRIIPNPEAHYKVHRPIADNQESTKYHIQKLITETNILLNEIKKSNSTLRNNIISNLNELTIDSKYLNNDINKIKYDLESLENGYAHCEKKKYQINEKLKDYIHENDKLKMLLKSNQIITYQNESNLEVTIDNKSNKDSHSINNEHETIPNMRNNQKWLVIGIPTVSRTHDEDYLLRTIQSVANQLPSDSSDLMYHQILINIVNLQLHAHPNKKHNIYEKAKEKYSSSKYFLFSDATELDKLPDPKPNTNAENDKGNANHPGYLVRRQTRSIVTVIKKNLNYGKYYLFLEDDMEFCPNGLLAIQYLLNKASRYHPDWLAIRASYGMNGIFMHNKDLETFANYLLKNQIRRPPDHLVVEWYAGETKESALYKSKRVNIGFKYNIFNHIGIYSTLRSKKQTTFPLCYDMLLVPTVFEVEAYNPRICPLDDIWPCQTSGGILYKQDQFYIDWSKQKHH